jgi:hypothetical protein
MDRGFRHGTSLHPDNNSVRNGCGLTADGCVKSRLQSVTHSTLSAVGRKIPPSLLRASVVATGALLHAGEEAAGLLARLVLVEGRVLADQLSCPQPGEGGPLLFCHVTLSSSIW